MSTHTILPGDRGRWVRDGNRVVLLPLGGGRRGATLAYHPLLGYRPVGAPPSAVRPIGRGSGLETEILGPDQRVHVADTLPVPFRFVCCLDLFFTHPNSPLDQIRVRGTGTLISDRHVLTAGHNLLFRLPGFPAAGRVAPARVTAIPARSGTASPFGEADAADMRVPAQWTAGTNAEFDFGLITLDVPLGAQPQAALANEPLGFWSCPRRGGGTRIRPRTVADLRNMTVNQAGYPTDKCEDQPAVGSATAAQLAACGIDRVGTMMWRSTGTVVNPSPPTEPLSITYDMDSFHGDSGGPVWLRWEQFRNLVAVHTGGFPDPADPTVIVANMGVRITEDVLRQLRAWMRADGVSANF
ncbi:MAG TPA: hypothetical protein VGO40_06980 [Longimicrobium sp.]|jgi:V8-like Glu-specific endopeptidase|nr:hypothetical protein [Longimicrobium sp.]